MARARCDVDDLTNFMAGGRGRVLPCHQQPMVERQRQRRTRGTLQRPLLRPAQPGSGGRMGGASCQHCPVSVPSRLREGVGGAFRDIRGTAAGQASPEQMKGTARHALGKVSKLCS